MRRLAATALVIAMTSASVVASAGSASAAQWDQMGSNYHSGGVDGWTFYTWCWSKKKRINDDTPNKDVFAFRMTSSANSENGKYLDKVWVEPVPKDDSPNQNWEGADPFKPDSTTSTNTSCTTWQWSIGAQAGVVNAAYSQSGDICQTESFGPKLYSDPGHHAAVWNDSDCVASGTVRKVAAGVLVRVAQGSVPAWRTNLHGADAWSSRSSC